MADLPPLTGRAFSLSLLAISALTTAAVSAARPMVSYAVLSIGGPPVALGIVASAFALVPLVAALPLGRWMDRLGPAPFLVVGTLLVAVSCLVLPVLSSVSALALDQMLLGLGQVQLAIAVQALIAARVARDRYEGAFGWFTVAVSLGQLLGPLGAGLLIGTARVSAAGLRVAFLGAAAAGFIGFALATLVLVADLRRRAGGSTSTRVRPVARGANRGSRRGRLARVGPVLLVSAVIVVTADAISVYLPALGLARGIPAATVGILLSVRAGASMLSRLAMGRLAVRVGRRRLLLGSLAIGGLGLLALPLVADAGVMAGLMLLIGLGLGIGQPLTMSWIARDAPADGQAAALGVRISANRLGQLVAPVSLGLMASLAGLPVVFWGLTGLLYVAGGLVLPVPFEPVASVEPGG